MQPVTVIATVNLYNVKLVSQAGRAITVAFDISNREGVQPGVKYGFLLTQSGKAGQVAADEKVFDEVLTLAPGAQLHKEITYTAPAQLSGTYDLWISSRTINGLPLGTLSVGKVTFYPSAEGSVSVDPASCYLTLQGDAKNTRYLQLQGVDIAATETLVAHCSGFKHDTSDSGSHTRICDSLPQCIRCGCLCCGRGHCVRYPCSQ